MVRGPGEAPDDDGDRWRTWDGLPVSREPPHGATVVVYRWHGRRPEFLLLHRRHQGPDFEGGWAWGPPSGARLPGEPVARCAARELREETGLSLEPRPLAAEATDWATYVAEAPSDAAVSLSDEHDRYAWVSLSAAVSRTAPREVAAQVLAAAQAIPRHR